jgi:hypothetical protein
MGNLLNWKSQSKEIRIIYVSEKGKNAKLYPLLWPDSFAQFVAELRDLFPTTKRFQQTKFLFKDACEKIVCVCGESTFQALVPIHRAVAPTVDLYYVSLETWIVED